MPALRFGLVAMSMRAGMESMLPMWFAGKLGVTHFVALLPAGDLAILNGDDNVERSATKVLADGHAVLGY
jgi:hypothetical protein